MTVARRAFTAAAALVACALVATRVVPRRSAAASLALAETDSRKRVAKLLLDGDVSEEIFCKGSDFAYCGAATCDVLTNSTAACGCKIYRGRESKFKLSWETALLVESAAFREAVLASHEGRSDRATTLICDAMADGSLYRDSFGASRGSVSLDVDKRRALSSGVRASCMGAPCSFDDTWNDDCDVTCICAIAAEETDTCLRNGVKQAYWDSYAQLLAVVDDIKAAFGSNGAIDREIRKDMRCRADCTVHHEGHDER